MKSMYQLKQFLSLILAISCLPLLSWGQDHPTDFLPMEFHKDRRDAVREKMPPNSVAVFFANPVRNRANDVDYIYHQDPNFYYLTGYREPHALLFIFKDQQKNGEESFDELLFVRPHNAVMEMWEGARLGADGAREKLKIANSLPNTAFKAYNLNFAKFDKILFYDFKEDVRDTYAKGDLFDLITQFKDKVNYYGNQMSTEEVPRPKKANLDTRSLDQIMVQLRGIKTEEELTLMRKAVNISAMGQVEVMKAMKPGMSELEVQGLHEFVYKKYQAEYEGYPSIVGAGHNGCVLHYIENYKPSIEDGELILMDLGAEYHGYTADVTRTLPVNGKFTPEQKQIYDLVYKAQEAAMAVCKAGASFAELQVATQTTINEGLVELGLYKSTKPKDMTNPETGGNRYYPHGCCHHIGLDVHDKGEYDVLQTNMVITIEPGIYITEGSPCDEKWWDIPVRIEDDFLVTEEGCELLSNMAPRKSEAVEAMMAQPSPFDAIVLPDLDGKE